MTQKRLVCSAKSPCPGRLLIDAAVVVDPDLYNPARGRKPWRLDITTSGYTNVRCGICGAQMRTDNEE